MERTVLLVHPEQRTKLNQLASKACVSAAEINRRAIDAYNPNNPKKDDEELDLLATAVIRSNKQAMKAIQEAQKSLKDTLCYFQKKHTSKEV
jgi:hypothetical protein